MPASPLAAEQPLVSVVTPVYNGGPYLAECIESVLAQSHESWDYTIVNNRSTDGSLDVAKRYAERDSRIRVEDNPDFLPQVANLNRALSCISAESSYCKVVLADDWMFPRCLAQMVAVAERHPTVGIVSAYRLDDRVVNCDGLPYPSTFVPGRDVCRASLLDDLFVFGSPSTLLFRSDLVRRRTPFYDASRLHEDTEACYEILGDHDLGFVHEVLTFTRRQDDSITARGRVADPHHLLDKLIVTLRFGLRYLDEGEYTVCLARVEQAYYRFLAERSLSRPGDAFWEYHRAGLASANYTLDTSKLRRFQAGFVVDRLVHPRRLVRGLQRLTPRPAGAAEDEHRENVPTAVAAPPSGGTEETR